MIKEIGHLGIVVRDIEESLKALSRIINVARPAIREFPEKKMRCAVVETAGITLELLQDYSEDGKLAQFIRGKEDAIHHFCFVSDNIEQDIETLKENGVEMMDQKPRTGLRGKKIAMLMPSALNGITIEISEP